MNNAETPGKIIWQAINSRKMKDLIKGMIGYFLCYCYVFSSLPSLWDMQPRVLANVLLVPVILTPAKTVGQFLDLSVLLLISVGISSALWAIVNLVAGFNSVGMGVILFLSTYWFSIPRAINPGRFFAFSLCGPVFVFTGIQSILNAYGPNTSNGSPFDYNFLIHTINSYLIGIVICLAVNVLIWPDFAERKLQKQLAEAMETIINLSSEIVLSLAGSESSHDLHETANIQRSIEAQSLRAGLLAISQTLDNADAEISYSRFSMLEYLDLFSRVSNLAGIILSIQTALQDPATIATISSQEFLTEFSVPMKTNLEILSAHTAKLLGEVKTRLTDTATSARTDHVRIDVQRTLEEFKRARPNLLVRSFLPGKAVEPNLDEREIREKWDKVLHSNFLILGISELVEEALNFHWALTGMNRTRAFQFNYRHFLPSIIAKHLFVPQTWSPSTFALRVSVDSLPHEVNTKKENTSNPWRSLAYSMKNFLLSNESIYGFKCGLALLCLHSILVAELDVFNSWYLGATLVTFLIALTPSLGQTYIALPIQIGSTSMGALAGFVAVTIFGPTGSFGIVGECCLDYLYVHDAVYSSFRVGVIDSSSLQLFALSFSLALTVIIFPRLSRNLLRIQLSTVIKSLSSYYTEIIHHHDSKQQQSQSTSPSPLITNPSFATTPIPEQRLSKMRDMKRSINTQFGSIAHLLETRIFQELGNAQWCVGRNVFDADVRFVFGCDQVKPWRGEMNQVNRLLFYLYSTCIIAKQPLPYDMPNASIARHRFFDAFIKVTMEHLKTITPNEELSPVVFNTDGWMRVYGMSVSLQEVSRQMDSLSIDFKALFGELPDLFAENPDLMWRNMKE
ncbi:hypothetical protein BDR26DRAFT_874571 [Obelidium mucronatum]|nr:hypothetical protein BDR26DRAFT_874571 [Obelidium mucronatum]